MYVLWAIALSLLLALGAFCWLVVVPVWQARRAVVAVHHAWKTARDVAPIRDRDEEKVLCRYVAELGGCKGAARRLRAYMNAPHFVAPHKEVALELLGRCEKPGVEPLVAALRSNEVLQRRSAARALFYVALRETHHRPDKWDNWTLRPAVSVGPRTLHEAVGALVGALADDDQSVRSWVVVVLAQVEPKDVTLVPALIGVLQGRSRMHTGMDYGFPTYALLHDRSMAAKVLAHIAPDHPAVLTALEKALNDSDESVRQAAAEALEIIKTAQEKKR